MALLGSQGAFQQRAEDGGFDVTPVALRRLDQQEQLVLVQGQRGGALEKAAVELEHREAQADRVSAAIHLAPELLHDGHEVLWLVAQTQQEIGEAIAGQQADIFGKHREQGAHQEGGHDVGVMVVLFERHSQLGQAGGDFTGNPRTAPGGVEFVRSGPYQPEPFADVGALQVSQEDPVAAWCGEGDVGAARAGKFGIQLDGMTDIHHDQEGRAPFRRGQGPAVLLRLPAGTQHGVIPGGRTAPRGACLEFPLQFTGGGGKGLLGLGDIRPLLGLQHETAPFIEIHAAGAGVAIAMLEGDHTFEHVGIAAVIRASGVRTCHLENVAEFGEEELIVGPFGSAGPLPAVYERLDDGKCVFRDGSFQLRHSG